MFGVLVDLLLMSTPMLSPGVGQRHPRPLSSPIQSGFRIMEPYPTVSVGMSPEPR